MTNTITTDVAPPVADLVRAAPFIVGVRAEPEDAPAGEPMLVGHFSRFDEWTEIDSFFEGRFMERVAPGAYKKTFREQGDKIRVLLEHGHDPQLGNKPIAEISELREDEHGAYYEARLLPGLPELVVEGLRAGQYGASFRFSVVRETFVQDPGVSDHNPLGLPERTLKEVRVAEFGPVTFGAYPGATAGVRSMTDPLVFGWMSQNPHAARSLVAAQDLTRAAFAAPAQDPQDPAPSDTDAAQGTSVTERRNPKPTALYGQTHEEKPTWRL